jgi:hypothetical protein
VFAFSRLFFTAGNECPAMNSFKNQAGLVARGSGQAGVNCVHGRVDFGAYGDDNRDNHSCDCSDHDSILDCRRTIFFVPEIFNCVHHLLFSSGLLCFETQVVTSSFLLEKANCSGG